MAENEAQFDYVADKKDAPAKAPRTVNWTASEYVDHSRGFFWYAALVCLSVALAAVVYILQKDFFASGVILVLGLIVAVAAARKPTQASYEVSAAGLKVGDKLYSFETFKSFSIVHEGHLTSLLFAPIKRLQTPVSAYFDPADEEEIADIIGEYLPFEQRSADRIDSLSRRLRF